MALVRTAELVKAGPVCAFNVITLEHAEAIVEGASLAKRPVILQISENAVRFHGGRLGPLAAAARIVAADCDVDAALHLDHVVTQELWEAAPEHGFGSFMVDASQLSYADNVAATRAAADFGHAHGLWVEAELGTIGGKAGDPHAPGARTDPAEAASYVAETGVDGLAVAVGSRHAMTSREASLDHDLIAALRAAVPVPLVLHGSSGVGDDELRRAVDGGIRKVNVGTALNLAYTGAIREGVGAQTDPRTYLAPARDAMAGVVAGYLTTVENRLPD
jgi:fructose-bisphosphate aldolase class II